MLSTDVQRAVSATPRLFAIAAMIAVAACKDSTAPGGNAGPGNGAVSVSVSPATMNVTPGASTTATVTVTRTGGFTGPVTLSASGLGSDVVASFDPATVPSGTTTSTLTVTAGASASAGTQSITVQAAGSGVASATATMSVTVGAPPAGSFSLAVSPASLTVMQGTSATASIAITRTGGFTGAVSLSIAGAPSGVSATVSPASVTGNTATLTVTAGVSAAAGSSTLTVQGTAAGQTAQSATVSAQVTPSSAAGIQWDFCGAGGPLWLAYQNDTGPWTALNVTNAGSVTIPIQTRGGVAFVEQRGGTYHLSVLYGTKIELVAASDWCGLYTGGKTVHASAVGLAGSAGMQAALGSGGASLAAGQQGAFTMVGVPDGPRDLIASRQQVDPATASLAADRIIIRRNLDPADGATLPVLDFAGAEAFAPVTHSATVGNVAGDQVQISGSFFTPKRTLIVLSSQLRSATASHSFAVVPTGRQAAGDVNMLIVTALDFAQPGTARSVVEAFSAPSDRTPALGPALASATVSAVATAPTARLRLQLPAQPEYDDHIAFGAGVNNGNGVYVSISASYLGATPASWDIAVPDLSGAGFDPAWGISSGTSAQWSITASGWMAGPPAPLITPTDGVVVLGASRSGTIVP